MEFKEVWRDDYLKWICGFANADGGVLIIGRDDLGKDVGVTDAGKLLEDLPNKIRVYADRLKIWNACELPENWTVEKLLQPHSSRPYNPIVANAFFRAGEIEAWGRGIQQIVDACRKAGSPDPVFDYTSGDLWIHFPYSTEYLRVLAAPKETSDGLGNRLGNGLGNIKDRILQEMKNNPRISGKQMADMLKISTTAVEKNIKQLREADLIKRTGGTRGCWEVMK